MNFGLEVSSNFEKMRAAYGFLQESPARLWSTGLSPVRNPNHCRRVLQHDRRWTPLDRRGRFPYRRPFAFGSRTAATGHTRAADLGGIGEKTGRYGVQRSAHRG